VFGTVDLHQFAQTIAARPRLVDALQPVFPPNPKAGADHPLPQRLDAKIQAVNLGQLLGRQGWTKIGVALTHDGQHGLPEYRTASTVAGPATLARNQTVRAVNSKRLEQSVNLSSANPDQPGSVLDR
jgi:hypothetical protein